MRVVESQWWFIELPEEWQASQQDETIVIADEDGVGEIAITTMEKEQGDVDDQELQDYTLELVKQHGAGQPCQLQELQGYYFSFREEGEAVREWYLRVGKLLVLITYSCDDENAGMDDSAVDEILDTLQIKTEGHL